MELDNITWRNLKSIYLTIQPIKKLVDGWCDLDGPGTKEAHITSYVYRHFLRRLVVRAFKELVWARKVHDITLGGLVCTIQRPCESSDVHRITWKDGTTTDVIFVDDLSSYSSSRV
jgi:hypothetical protein